MRILVVDDDPKFRRYLRRGLADSQIESDEAEDGKAALELLEEAPAGHFDLVLLDVMMPEATGWDVLERLRGGDFTTPVIFVTARDAVDERVKGLAMGADDYIIKPFAFSELLARVDAVMRRRRHLPNIELGDVTIDLARRRVRVGEREVELATKEFDLLHALADGKGRVLSRKKLLKDVWDIDFDPETNVVDVYVARLRRKLGPRGKDMIATVRGEGYRLDVGQEESA